MSLATTDDLYIDNVRMVLDWDKFDVGMSVFIPCVSVEAVRVAVAEQMQRRGYGHTTRYRVENGVVGLRLWRTE